MNKNTNSKNTGETTNSDEFFSVSPLSEPRILSGGSKEGYRARERGFIKGNWSVPYFFVPNSYSYNLHLFISITFLTVIVVMLAYMVNTIFSNVPNSVECLKDNKKFRSKKLNETKKIKTKASEKKSKDKKQEHRVDSLSGSLFDHLREGVLNWWEKKPLQRERFLNVSRGGYQLLTRQELKITLTNMDPVFLLIHLYKLENELRLQLEKISQLSNELNISEKNSEKPSKQFKKLFGNGKLKNPFVLLDKGFKRLSGVVGFGVALRILTLIPLEPLEPLNPLNLSGTKTSNDLLIQNYQDLVPRIPGTNQLQIQVGDKILVFSKKETKELTNISLPKQLPELTGSTSSLEVQNLIKNKNINEITPSVISKRQKLKLTRPRKKTKLMRLSDLPKIPQKSTTEEIFSVSEVTQTNRQSIRIRVQ